MQDLLKNPSAAAFIGAFSAFFLVILNDWRRRRRKRNLISYLVDDNRTLAIRKLETVQNCLELLNENKSLDAPIMRFLSDPLSKMHLEVMDMLSATQNQALAALLYWMEAIDDLLDQALKSAIELRRLGEIGATDNQKAVVLRRLDTQYRDAISNLYFFIEYARYYVDQTPAKILEHKKPIGRMGDNEV
jgi:hypothetical protein